LTEAEPWGAHGRPDGQFRKWKLNAFGFRAPPMDRQPRPGQQRVMILGASETFGLYEDAGMEYPAQLALLLQQKYEVINAAMAGITLKSMIPYWDNWAGNFGANKVIVYPSPMFYLDAKPPAAAPHEKQVAWQSFRPRLAERFRDVYHALPDCVRALREEWVIEREGAADDGEFIVVPEERLRLFRQDLCQLVRHIRARGAEPILLTHASSAAWPPRPEDDTFIRRMRMFFPRAKAATLVEFERQANAVIRGLVRQHQVRFIDVDQALTGQRELFADMVHFNNGGATKMAELLARHLEP